MLYSGPFTVLLFEQDARRIDVIRSAFAASGLQNTLRFIRSFDEALGYLEGRGAYENRSSHSLPSLFLVNLELKDGSGWSFLEWFAKQRQDIRIPIVALMSINDPVTARRAYDVGVTSCLVTPLDPREVRELAKAIAIYWGQFEQAPERHRQPGRSTDTAAPPSDPRPRPEKSPPSN